MALEISNFDPAPSQGIGSGAPLRFDVTGTGAYALIVEIDGVRQLAWDGAAFAIPFAGQSSRSAISGGYRYTLRRNDNRWPLYPSILLRALSDSAGADVDPTPNTIPVRGGSGELNATAHEATDGTRSATLAASSDEVGVIGTGAAPTVLQATGDTRIALTGSGQIELQQWVTSAWVTRATLSISPTGIVIQSDDPLLRADSSVKVYTSGNEATAAVGGGEIGLSATARYLYAIDEEGHSIALNRTRPVVASSGVQTLTYDRHHVLSGTATASALPAATADDVGRCVAISNRTAGTLTISRAGSDTIDGATSFALAAGAKVVFEVTAAGDWAAWG